MGRPPTGRLTKRSQYLAVAAGRRIHTERMTVQGRRRDDGPSIPEGRPDPAAQTGLRLGFTVTKKSGHATERNRIRRRLKSAAAAAGLRFAAEPVDIVVIGRPSAIGAPFPVLVGDLGAALDVLTAAGSSASGPSPKARSRRRGRSRTA